MRKEACRTHNALGNTATYLTEREKQVLSLHAQGYTIEEAGNELGIAYSTARNLMQSARDALGAANGPHLVVLALQREILNLEDLKGC